jgi:hypothetical protein
MIATLMIAQRTVVHNDATAAGWTDGFWWKLDLDGHPETPEIESGAPTREAAIETATAIAQARGPYKVVVLD